MKTIFKLALILLLAGNNATAQNTNNKNDIEKKKNITQTYELAASDKVSLSNKFGDIKINTWTENKIKVDIEIEVSAKTEAKAVKIIDGIVIKHSKSDGLVSFKTVIDQSYGGGNSVHYDDDGNGASISKTISTTTSKSSKSNEKCDCDDNYNYSYNGNSQSMRINYTVYLPSQTKMKLRNEFGNTTIDNYAGALDLVNEYGNLTAGILSSEANEIAIEYGNADIKSLINPDFKIGYGNCDIATINGNGEMHFDYSSDITLGFGKDIGNVKMTNGYSTMEITVDERANASFMINSSYGNVKSKNKALEIKTDKDDDEDGCCNFTKKHEAKIGNGTAKISINNDYGSIKFR
jgi:hypothetical protein